MAPQFPLTFDLSDGTHVVVHPPAEEGYALHLTRLNSEKHNFLWHPDTGAIEESYETRFDKLQLEAVDRLRQLLAGG